MSKSRVSEIDMTCENCDGGGCENHEPVNPPIIFKPENVGVAIGIDETKKIIDAGKHLHALLKSVGWEHKCNKQLGTLMWAEHLLNKAESQLAAKPAYDPAVVEELIEWWEQSSCYMRYYPISQDGMTGRILEDIDAAKKRGDELFTKLKSER